MLIDWFTVVAQALNFIVLAWLLKRFLYRPILDAVDAREARVAAEIANADKMRNQAQADRDALEGKQQALDSSRDALMKQASEAAADERRRLMDDARRDAAAMRRQAEQALQKELQDASRTLQEATAREVFSIARKALFDMADVDVQAHMIDVFLRRLYASAGDAREPFRIALANAGEVTLRTAFELTPEQGRKIDDALEREFGTRRPLRHEIRPDLVCGVELLADGRKVSWTIAEFLGGLQENVSSSLKRANDVDAPQ